MLQTNWDTLLFCSNLLCRELLQVSEYGPRKEAIRYLIRKAGVPNGDCGVPSVAI
jgi:hypothetical protein